MVHAAQQTQRSRQLVEVAWLVPAFVIGLLLFADGALKLPYFAWHWPLFITALTELVGGAAMIVRWTRAWGSLLVVLSMVFATLAETAVLGMVSARPNVVIAGVATLLAWHWSGRYGPRSLLISFAGFVTGIALIYVTATLILLGSSVQTLG